MSIIYENYLIIVFCFLAFFFAVKYVLSLKLITKEREYFIKTLSHDLRVSVIAQIRGLELLDKNIKNTQADLLNELNFNCKYTLDMISMLINTYKNKNNELLVNYESINLSNLILKITKDLEESAQEKEIAFNYYNESNLIMADKVWITKALQIIISTIIALSDRKTSIICSIKNLRNKIKIEFNYSGRSLTDEEYQKMFAGNTQYSTVGFGIKMHLLKNIIDLHFGKITVKNNFPDKNSFVIVLPMKIPAYNYKTKAIKELQPFRL